MPATSSFNGMEISSLPLGVEWDDSPKVVRVEQKKFANNIILGIAQMNGLKSTEEWSKFRKGQLAWTIGEGTLRVGVCFQKNAVTTGSNCRSGQHRD